MRSLVGATDREWGERMTQATRHSFSEGFFPRKREPFGVVTYTSTKLVVGVNLDKKDRSEQEENRDAEMCKTIF